MHLNGLMTQPLVLPHFPFDSDGDGTDSKDTASQRLELHDRDSSLYLYNTIQRAVTEVEIPMIFSRPDMEGRFLSRKVVVISTDGTSLDSGSCAHISFLATFPRAFKTSLAARSPASTAPSM